MLKTLVVAAALLLTPALASACAYCNFSMHCVSDPNAEWWCVSVCDAQGCICDMGGGCGNPGGGAPGGGDNPHDGFKNVERSSKHPRWKEVHEKLHSLKNYSEIVAWCAATPGCDMGREAPKQTWGRLKAIYR